MKPSLFQSAFAAVLIVLGVALLVAGLWLIVLGGSWYYALAGAGFVLTGLLLLSQRSVALWLFALVVLSTLGWSISETGLDWWPLAARGDAVFVIGVLMVLFWGVGWLGRTGPDLRAPAWRRSAFVLTGSLVIAGAVGIAAILVPHQGMSKNGAFPEATGPSDLTALGAGNPGDWIAYGRTDAGDRYSPLTGITTSNVDKLKRAWVFHTGDIRQKTDPADSIYEVTPLKAAGKLFVCPPPRPDLRARSRYRGRDVAVRPGVEGSEESPAPDVPRRLLL